jgi:ribose transport system ATP-binding protein
LVEAVGLGKVFGGAVALDDVTLTIGRGEVLGLVGENGSGKSTLIKILAGYHKPDSGSLLLDGEVVGTTGLVGAGDSAASLYVAFVHQDLGLIDELDVVENFYIRDLAKSPTTGIRSAVVPWRQYRQHVTETLERFGVVIADTRSAVAELTPLTRAMLAIVRAVDEINRSGATSSLLVLDEPTVYLPGQERLTLYELIRRVAVGDSSVLLVSHDIDEVLQVADRVTVLRDGRMVGTVASAEASRGTVVEMMVGSSQFATLTERSAGRAGTTTLDSTEDALEFRDLRGGGVGPVSARIRSGEVVGVAGLVGSGYHELTRLIYGATPIDSGDLLIAARLAKARHSPRRAIGMGAVLVPGDRIREGGIGSLSLKENVFYVICKRFMRRGVVQWKKGWASVHDRLVEFDVRPPDGDRDLGTLSGGNQQKAIFAKWSQLDPRLMLLEEPTQGVDVGARAGIWQFIGDAASRGAGVLVSSSDYEELVTICDRVLIVSHGEIISELGSEELSKQAILAACHGGNVHSGRTGP